MMKKWSRVSLKRHLRGKCRAVGPAQLRWEAFVYTPAANSAPNWFFPPFGIVGTQLFAHNYKGKGVFHFFGWRRQEERKKKIKQQRAAPQHRCWEGPAASGCPAGPGSRIWSLFPLLWTVGMPSELTRGSWSLGSPAQLAEQGGQHAAGRAVNLSPTLAGCQTLFSPTSLNITILKIKQ